MAVVMLAPMAVVSAVWMTVAIVASLTVTTALATLTPAQLKKVIVAVLLAVVMAGAFATTSEATTIIRCGDWCWWI